jgi:hypothetical protein
MSRQKLLQKFAGSIGPAYGIAKRKIENDLKKPGVGQQATQNGKPVVYSGENYGYQSPASHQKLKEEGKFRAGTQALDRISSSAGRAVRQHAPAVAQHFDNIKADQQRAAAAQDKAIRNTAGNRVANALQQDATENLLNKVSKATNVDRRIVGATAAAAQAVVAKKALGGAKPQPQPQPRSVGAANSSTKATAVGSRIKSAAAKKAASEGRSVGAAARADVAGKANGRQLYTPKVDGAVTKSGQKVGGRVAPYSVKNGSRTIANATPTPTTKVGAGLGGAKKTTRLTSPAEKVPAKPNILASRGRPKYETPNAVTGRTGKRLKEAIDTAKGKPRASSNAQQSINTRQYGTTNRLSDGRRVRGTEPAYNPTSTRFAEGTRRSDRVAPPRSRTTSPTKAEQKRAVKSGLRDRGQAFAEAQLPRSSRATANQARGNRYSASRNGQGPDPNYGTRQQPRSTTGNNKVEIQGDSRESARNFARERAAAYNSGDPTAQSPARRRGAQQIIKDRVAKETQGMTAAQRRDYKQALEKKANQGERRVKAAAEAQFKREVRRDRYGRSPSTAQQNYVPASRDQRRLSDSARNKMAEDFGNLKRAAGPIKPTAGDKANNAIPASTPKGVKKATTPSNRDLTRSSPAKPVPVSGEQKPPTRLNENGRVEHTTLGRPRPNVGNASQRRTENLPAPGPQTRRQANERSRSQRADASLRDRNAPNRAVRTRDDALRRLRSIMRANREARQRGR